MPDSDISLNERVLEKIEYGEKLIDELNNYKLDGIGKLERKIRQELTFLKKVQKTNTIKQEHLQCTNLTHYSALLSTLKNCCNCTSVSKAFTLNDRKLIVDIICDGGLTWIKVIARNPKSLSQISLGDTNYGVRSILDQADDFLECSLKYPIFFQRPQVVFVFANGVDQRLAAKLELLQIKVEGTRLDLTTLNLDDHDDANLDSIDDEEKLRLQLNENIDTFQNTLNIKRLNIDVSAMLAYVSSVTNGSCDKYEFDVPVLAQQAKWELTKPVKPLLENLFKNKQLYCCQTARDDFLKILNTVGGPNEKVRGLEFLKRIQVLPDNATIDDIADVDDDVEDGFSEVQYTGETRLEIGGKIRERSLKIFTFGDRIRAVTVTSNDGFVRAAKQKGINFVVFVHDSRALTEQKETKATLRKQS